MAEEFKVSNASPRADGSTPDPRIWREILGRRIPAAASDADSSLSPWERCWRISQEKAARAPR